MKRKNPELSFNHTIVSDELEMKSMAMIKTWHTPNFD